MKALGTTQKKAAILGLLLAFLLLLGAVSPVQAAEFDDDGIVKAGETVDDDLFLSGETVSMEGEIDGNLLASGQTVTVSGTVKGDAILMASEVIVAPGAVIEGNLFSGASSIKVAGEIGGSIAAGSASLEIQKETSVARNVYYGGFSLSTESGSVVERGLYAALYQAILNGQIDRNVNLAAGAVELGGMVGRDVMIDFGSGPVLGQEANVAPMVFIPNAPQLPPAIDPGLRVANGAQIGGKLTYTSVDNLTSGIQGQPEGGVVFQTPVPPAASEEDTSQPVQPVNVAAIPMLGWLLNVIRLFVTLLILGGLAIWLVPSLTRQGAAVIADKPLAALGYGIAVLLIGFGAAFMALGVLIMLTALFSLVGLGGLAKLIFFLGFAALFLAFMLFIAMLVYGSKLLVAYLIGDRVVRLFKAQGAKPVWVLVAGIAVFVLVRSVPILGGLFDFLAAIFGLGAGWLLFSEWRRNRKAAPAAPLIEEVIPSAEG